MFNVGEFCLLPKQNRNSGKLWLFFREIIGAYLFLKILINHSSFLSQLAMDKIQFDRLSYLSYPLSSAEIFLTLRWSLSGLIKLWKELNYIQSFLQDSRWLKRNPDAFGPILH